ncbi:hypothetical protein CQA44_07670 [Helicobacter sp. MIT 14-3879]|nr:hypothetical protein CQA44_07670 [Helicobacter sp. MIT 14-3879]
MKLYIIVPIYNVEKYLKECLDSIQNQTYKNFSAILINDGSTDSSKSIAEEYTKKDNRFYLINQENSGIGYARNKGLYLVKEMINKENDSDSKSYIMFVDSDDYLENFVLEYISNIILKYDNLDCVIQNYYYHLINNKKKKSNRFFNSQHDNLYDSNVDFLKENVHLNSVWINAYNANFYFLMN